VLDWNIKLENYCLNRFISYAGDRKFARILGGVVLAMGMKFDRNAPVDWSVEGEIRAGFGDQDPKFEILNAAGSDGMMHQRHYSCTHFLTSFEDARAELKRVGSERAANTQMVADQTSGFGACNQVADGSSQPWGGTNAKTLSKARGSGLEAIMQAILFGPDTCDVYVLFGY